MANITSTITVQQDPRTGIDSPGVKRIYVITPSTTDGGDTYTLTLSSVHADTFLGIFPVRHTTANSVVVSDTVTTSVSAGVLTVTLGAALSFTDNKCVHEILLGQGGL